MADLDDALKLRDEAKARYLRDFLRVDAERKVNFAAFGMSDVADYVPPDQRLAVGVAFGADGKKNMGLALRAGKRDGVAYRAANEIANTAAGQGQWADVRVVENLQVPARSDLAPAKPIKGFPIDCDPLVVGISVGHPKAPAGSLGGFVRLAKGGDGIISACHVLANSGRGITVKRTQKPTDDSVYVHHPASQDLPGRLRASNRIGWLIDMVELGTPTVEVDTAVAALLPDRGHLGNVIPDIESAKNSGQRILKPPKPEQIAKFKTVAKIGRTTGYTEGRLSAGYFDDVGLQVPGTGIVYYNKLFEIESESKKTPFAQPGDSGAVVFDVESRHAFAMIVGGGEWERDGETKMLIYSCNLAAALEAMDAQWL